LFAQQPTNFETMKRCLLIGLIIASCSAKDKYDVARYYDLPQQDKLLTHILTFMLDAPPSVPMKERFDSKHYNYYSFQTSKFSIVKYFIADDGTHYFYIMRPTSVPGEKRGVGGHFKMNKDFQLTDFREVFVTTAQPEKDIKEKSAFLFDEMVKGDITKYLSMTTYVQWPNEASYYDTLTYEWKLKPELESN
jgi:hypothetical protein